MNPLLKAYRWEDGDEEHSCIGWFKTRGQARAYVASELDIPFTEAKVWREPWADKYSSMDEIPVEEFLKNHWTWACAECGRQAALDEGGWKDGRWLCEDCLG